MDSDKTELLVRRNRMLLAMAVEERRVSRETRARAFDAWQLATEVRQRASSTREKWRAARSDR